MKFLTQIILFATIIGLGCKSIGSKEYLASLSYKPVLIDTEKVNVFFSNFYDFPIRPQLEEINGHLVLVYIDKFWNLCFNQIDLDKTQPESLYLHNRVCIRNYISLNPRFSSYLSTENDKSNYLLNTENNKLYKLNFDSIYTSCTIDSIYLNIKLDSSLYRVVNADHPQPFTVIDSFAYIPYLNKKEGNYYSEQYAYLRININNNMQDFFKCIPHPKEYKSGKRIDPFYYVFRYSKDTVVTFYEGFDKALLFNKLDNSKHQIIEFNKHSNFNDFDISKITDLAYYTKYSSCTEQNVKILKLKESYLIIKRLKKVKNIHQSNYEYLVLDKALKLKYYNIFQNISNSLMVCSYKNGFVVLDLKSKECHYYEIK